LFFGVVSGTIMEIGLVTDSPADVPPDLAEQYGIEVIPAILVVEGEQYIDGVNLSREEYYRRLPAMKTPPTTAAPALGEFVARYQKLFSAGCQHIISLHTAGALTSILNFAQKAAEEFIGRVTVLDSGQLSLGVGYQVLAAAEAIEKGLGLEETLQVIQHTRERVRVGAALDTMTFLRRSGRVPATVAALGGLLSIKPLLSVHDGQVNALGMARTTHSATERLLNILADLGPLEKLAVLHTNAETRAREFIDLLMALCRRNIPPEIRIVNVTTVIGAHVGPNGLGFAAVMAA
jgi:DegV family protein with EDD domain